MSYNKDNKGANANADKGKTTYIKDSIIRLDDFKNQEVRVTFLGGRQITGVLKEFDSANNMVLDECTEYLRDAEDPYLLSGATRKLGLIFLKGAMMMTIAPSKEIRETADPFNTENKE